MLDEERGTSSRGTDQRGTDRPDGRREPQAPCGLMPYHRDDRIWWAFHCGIKRSLKESENSALERMVEKLGRWSLVEVGQFAQAYHLGVGLGCGEALARYYKDMVSLVRSVLGAALDGADAAYDIEVYKRMQAVYGAPPGSEAQKEALANLGDYFTAEYPSFAAAIRGVALLSAALEALIKWIKTDPAATWRIAVAISSSMGQVIGAEAGDLLAVADSADKLGMATGKLLGNATTELALLVLGY